MHTIALVGNAVASPGAACAIRFHAGLAALALSTAWGQFASAQTLGPLIREPDDVPGRRTIPQYKAIGYELAGFDILPAITFGTRADDNVFTRSNMKMSDLVLNARSQLRIIKKARFDALTIDAMALSSTYLNLPEQDSIEHRIEASYARGTTGPNSITVNLGHRREAVQRGTVENDLPRGEPLMRRVLHGSLTGRKQFHRLSIDAQLTGMRQSYEDIDDAAGGSIEQRFRNVTRYGLKGIASYDISGRTAIVASIEYDHFNYAPSRRLVNRDAENRLVTMGVRYEVTRLLYAHIGVGYRRYDFRNPALGAISGLAVWGRLRFFPSRVLAIRGSIEQSNTTSPYDLVGAVRLTTSRIEVEYEMRRSLSWLAESKFTLEDYGKHPYAARRAEVSFGPRWRINRSLSADANVGYAKRFVNGVAPFEPYSHAYGSVSVTFAR